MAPKGDKTKAKGPWDNARGKAVHPKAPVGGGGPGGFRSAKPLQNVPNPKKPLPHPQSPVGNNTAPIDKPRDLSVPPPPALDMRALMAAKARALVGQPIISNPRNGNREECYDMVDMMLVDLGAKSAPEYMKRVGTNDDYVWGKAIKTSEIQPGDILQIRNSELELIETVQYKAVEKGQTAPEGSKKTTTMSRGHHTAVVIAINPDGSFQVSEQHVLDESRKGLSRTIRENTFPLKDIEGEPQTRTTTKDSVKVVETKTKSWKVKGGKVWPYRPEAK